MSAGLCGRPVLVAGGACAGRPCAGRPCAGGARGRGLGAGGTNVERSEQDAQQACQLLLLVSGEPREELALAPEEGRHCRVDPSHAVAGELDQHAPLVQRVVLSPHESPGFEPVDAVCHGAGGDQRRA